MWQTILGAISAPLTALVDTWSLNQETKAEIKQIKAQAAIDAAKQEAAARIEAAAKQAETIKDFDLASLKAGETSWKDELWTIILAIMLLANFLPNSKEFMRTGWENLALAPEWFNWIVPAAIAVSLGVRGLRKW